MWEAYDAAVGESHPAVGQLDTDAAAEILVGLARYPGDGGWVGLLDDAAHGFTLTGWHRVGSSAFQQDGGATFPAIGRPR
jgi:hypothetical protein